LTIFLAILSDLANLAAEAFFWAARAVRCFFVMAASFFFSAPILAYAAFFSAAI